MADTTNFDRLVEQPLDDQGASGGVRWSPHDVDRWMLRKASVIAAILVPPLAVALVVLVVGQLRCSPLREDLRARVHEVNDSVCVKTGNDGEIRVQYISVLGDLSQARDEADTLTRLMWQNWPGQVEQISTRATGGDSDVQITRSAAELAERFGPRDPEVVRARPPANALSLWWFVAGTGGWFLLWAAILLRRVRKPPQQA